MVFRRTLKLLWDLVVYQVVGYYVTRECAVQVVGLFDVAARLSSGDGPIAEFVGGSRCSIDSALQQVQGQKVKGLGHSVKRLLHVK